tara:strand:- start:497 stop:703 length:207 start_codon:yes stop_codon:yes gene_type:complete
MNNVIGNKYTRELTPLEDELAGALEEIIEVIEKHSMAPISKTLSTTGAIKKGYDALERAKGIKDAADQ